MLQSEVGLVGINRSVAKSDGEGLWAGMALNRDVRRENHVFDRRVDRLTKWRETYRGR